MFKSISVIGGDLRQLTIAREMSDDGYDVYVTGFDHDIQTDNVNTTNDHNVIFDSDIIILPVPVTFDNHTVNMPYSDSEIKLDELSEKINRTSVVFGGKIPLELCHKLEEKGIMCRDYMQRDELAARNAIPTAEGAIEIAISETPFTIHSSKCLVFGYGKIGKILAKTLRDLGADTYVEARKYADLALIECHGYHPLTMKEAKMRIGEFDIIFNTVPALVMDRDTLSKVRKDSLIIDLASKPGGVDFDSAKSYGLRVIWALSLPGRVAPITAGIIIKDTIKNIISELEV